MKALVVSRTCSSSELPRHIDYRVQSKSPLIEFFFLSWPVVQYDTLLQGYTDCVHLDAVPRRDLRSWPGLERKKKTRRFYPE